MCVWMLRAAQWRPGVTKTSSPVQNNHQINLLSWVYPYRAQISFRHWFTTFVDNSALNSAHFLSKPHPNWAQTQRISSSSLHSSTGRFCQWPEQLGCTPFCYYVPCTHISIDGPTAALQAAQHVNSQRANRKIFEHCDGLTAANHT